MQRHIYEVCAAPVVKFVLEGYNGTVFAEGQMGSGQSETSLRGSPFAFERIFDTSPLVYGALLAQSSPRLKLPGAVLMKDLIDVVVKSVSDDCVL